MMTLTRRTRTRTLRSDINGSNTTQLLRMIKNSVKRISSLIPRTDLLILVQRRDISRIIRRLTGLILLNQRQEQRRLPNVSRHRNGPTLNTRPRINQGTNSQVTPRLLTTHIMNIMMRAIRQITRRVIRSLGRVRTVQTNTAIIRTRFMLRVRQLHRVRTIRPSLIKVSYLIPGRTLFNTQLNLRLTMGNIRNNTMFKLTRRVMRLVRNLTHISIIRIMLLKLMILSNTIFLSGGISMIINGNRMTLLAHSLMRLSRHLSRTTVSVIPNILLTFARLFSIPNQHLQHENLSRLLSVAIRSLVTARYYPL